MTNVGIVGAGLRGQMFSRALGFVPGVKVVGVAEPNAAAAANLTTSLGIPAYNTAHDLYEAHDLDAAIIATPDFAHEEPAVEGAERGINLLIEKPLAMSLESAYAIADAAAKGGGLVVTAFENRWNPPFMEARAALEAGEIGDIQSQYALISSTTRVPLQMLSWASKSSPLWFLMSHTLDLVLLFSGKRVVTVSATGSCKILRAHGMDTLDAVQALLTFDDDTTALLESSWALPEQNMPAYLPFRFEVRGSTGMITIDLTSQSLAISGPAGYRWPRTYFPTVDGRFQAFPAWMAQSFVGNVNGDSSPDVSLEHAISVTEVQVAIERSIAERHTVALPLERPDRPRAR